MSRSGRTAGWRPPPDSVFKSSDIRDGSDGSREIRADQARSHDVRRPTVYCMLIDVAKVRAVGRSFEEWYDGPVGYDVAAWVFAGVVEAKSLTRYA